MVQGGGIGLLFGMGRTGETVVERLPGGTEVFIVLGKLRHRMSHSGSNRTRWDLDSSTTAAKVVVESAGLRMASTWKGRS